RSLPRHRALNTEHHARAAVNNRSSQTNPGDVSMQRTNRRRDFAVVTLLAKVGSFLAVLSLLVAAAYAQDESASSASNLVRLLAGNVRFVGGNQMPKDYLAERLTLV